MKVKFWGVRGSIPTPITDKIFKTKLRSILNDITIDDISTSKKKNKFIEDLSFDKTIIGGNTPCVELQIDKKLFIFDMGSGIIQLGNYLAKKQREGGLDLHIFISHTHWDHISGLPFFKPAFYSNNKITFYSPIPNLEKRLILQQDPKYFPISLDDCAAKKKFVQLDKNGTIEIDGVKIENILQYHPGSSYGYRIKSNGKTVIYSTDSEHKHKRNEQNGIFINFFQDADILIFDAQYTLEEAINKKDWGHSSALTGIDLAVKSNVKKLILFHHEPDNDDKTIYKILTQSIKYKKEKYPNINLEILLAYEGLEIDL
ncbi:MAG: MBL fold metallo-hydrolase [Candidatus Marinimicrobia bacterium]|nr:MBL fold metallo-hydrolase [Candidatus Neomarinimicrobiota bacterium]